MGFALPGAIAASLVYPDRNILGIAGKAGFLMNVQEMETAKRYNTGLVMLVWEDKENILLNERLGDDGAALKKFRDSFSSVD